ncbi:hypothetical protein ACJX0J_020657, partial [Zea mays]
MDAAGGACPSTPTGGALHRTTHMWFNILSIGIHESWHNIFYLSIEVAVRSDQTLKKLQEHLPFERIYLDLGV